MCERPHNADCHSLEILYLQPDSAWHHCSSDCEFISAYTNGHSKASSSLPAFTSSLICCWRSMSGCKSAPKFLPSHTALESWSATYTRKTKKGIKDHVGTSDCLSCSSLVCVVHVCSPGQAPPVVSYATCGVPNGQRLTAATNQRRHQLHTLPLQRLTTSDVKG